MLSVAGLLALTTALNVVLGLLVTVRKVRRDRRERLHAGHRDDLRRAMAVGGNDLDRLMRRAARRPNAMIDLAQVLPGMIRSDRAWVGPSVRVAAVRSGLADVLEGRLRARRASVRGTAALLVGLLGLPRAAELLAPLLRDRDGDVRLVAAGALTRVGTGQAATVLIAALVSRSLPDERVVERLGARWATVSVLARLETGDATARVRSSLARALGLSGDPRGEGALVALLESPHLEVRVSATRALATCGTADCAAALLRRLDDSAWEVRAQAAVSLGALGIGAAVPRLARQLRDQSWWARANAATALGMLGDAGVDALHVAAEDSDVYAAERARETLAGLRRAA